MNRLGLPKSMAGLLLTALLGIVWISHAELPVPPLTAPVIDQTTTLTPEQQRTIEQRLRAFEQRKGSQIALLLVATTQPESIEQYSMRVVEQWKLGREKIDDGVLLIIAKDDRTLRIEVGYGLEGVLNDALSKRIISELITPRLRQGDFYGGITAGIEQIIRLIDGEPLPPPSQRPARDRLEIANLLPLLFIIVLMAGGALRALLGRPLGALVSGTLIGLLTWFLAGALLIALLAGIGAFLFTLLGHAGRGLGGFPGGFGGRGGFGGGGFGGGFSGGGGGFGGGGASGRW